MGATEEKGRGEREGGKEVVAEWAEWQTRLTEFFGGEATCTLEKNKRDFFSFLISRNFRKFHLVVVATFALLHSNKNLRIF